MDGNARGSLEQLVHRFRRGGLSRGRFIAALAALGVSATGVATIVASAAENPAAALPPGMGTRRAVEHRNKHLHHAHVRRQSRALRHGASGPGRSADTLSEGQRQYLQAILDDYADDAVVEDPRFPRPFVGKEAIARRKAAELVSMSGLALDVVHRVAHGDQVIAEWVVRGHIHGEFLGLVGNGRWIEMRGVTVATRQGGKIVRESLHYDLAALQRQLAG